MLYSEGYEKFTILSIDPGLHHIGLSVFDIDTCPVKICSIDAMTLHSHRVIDTSGLDDDDFIERVRIRHSMAAAFRKIIEERKPCIIVCESAFFDKFRPGSFAILTEVLTTLFDTAASVNPSIRFSFVAPLLVKNTLGVAGQKGKDVVREAMLGVSAVIDPLIQPLEHLDEHGVDAVAVGYTYLLRKSGLYPEPTPKRRSPCSKKEE